MKVDAVLFDVDGVLIDTRRSFNAAVLDAVTIATGLSRFGPKEMGQLKSIPGFNNDWHVAIAGGAWIRYCDGLSFTEFARSLEQRGGGLAALRQVVGAELTADFEHHLTRLAQEAYGGTTACARLYGFEPATIRAPGRWCEEVACLTREAIEPLLDRIGIVTGRSAAEMELAFRVLGWRLPRRRVAVSDDPTRDKPDPGKLLVILDNLDSRRAVFAGDSRDDLDMVHNACRQGAKVDFCCIGSEPVTWPGVVGRFTTVREMLSNIEVEYDATKTC